MGKNVRQLTSFPGEELLPKFSPDGAQIAFTAEFEGNKEIYLMSVLGGKPRRLTFHPAEEYVVDWNPDGTKIMFRSNGISFSFRFSRLQSVSVHGGLPEVLELPEAELSGYNETGDKIAFCRTSTKTLPWKRYRGGAVPNIWTYDFIRRKAELVVTDSSINHHPVWIGNNIYFVSDRGENKVQNLWVYDYVKKDVRQITYYNEWGVNWPSKGNDEIIFENEGRLCTYKLKNEQISILNIEVPIPQSVLAGTVINVKNLVSNPAISPDGKQVIVSARGELFYLVPENNITQNLTQTSGVNERYPVWSPDGKKFAYISDVSGEEQIYTQTINTGNNPVQISNCMKSRLGMLCWSPDGKKIGFADNRAAYYILDIETGECKKVYFNAYLGSIKFVSASWSPDSRWLVYANGNPNWFGSIFLYSLENGTSYRVTDEFTNSFSPKFDPDGKYLFWISDCDVNIEDSYWDSDHHMINPSKIIVTTLRKDLFSPFSPDWEKNIEAQQNKQVPLQIDIDGLGQRITALPVEDSNYSDLFAVKGRLIYQSSPAKGESAIKMFDIAGQKEYNLLKDAFYCNPAPDAEKIVYLASGMVGILDFKPDQKAGDGALDLTGMNMTIDYRKEWRQIFYEAWRMQRDFFFDENLHGVDWEAMKHKYETMLLYVASRSDLNYLIEELLSELGQSHVEISGGDLQNLPQVNNGLLGADLEFDKNAKLYKITRIFRGQNWDPDKTSPLTLPGMNIKAGDYLLAVDGFPLNERINPDSLLEGKAGTDVVLTVNEKPAFIGSRSVTVKPASFSGQYGDLLRYNDWVLSNINKVNQATGGKVGYIHIPDTYIPGMESFFRYFNPQMTKQALIIDIRYNSGGYPPYWMIERLNRKLLLYSHLPYGKAAIPEPDYGFFGPKVCITNEWAESGGEKYTATFRLLNGGPIIGKRTSGNLASTGGFRLIDSGIVIYPAEGPQNAKGENIIENTGVSPDIEVTNLPEDMIGGNDPQLERSIKEIMKMVAAKEKIN